MNFKKIIIILMFLNVIFLLFVVQLVNGDDDDVHNNKHNNNDLKNDRHDDDYVVVDDGYRTLTKLRRSRRHLAFKPGSRVFFRLNIKDNVWKINQIWAHAFGFRANYDIKYPWPKEYKIRKRDIHDTIEELITQHGFDGRACILRSFCEASKSVTPESGMFFKLFKMIFRNTTKEEFDDDFDSSNRLPDGDEKSRPYLNSNDCDELSSHCPLSFMDLSTYTDV